MGAPALAGQRCTLLVLGPADWDEEGEHPQHCRSVDVAQATPVSSSDGPWQPRALGVQ